MLDLLSLGVAAVSMGISGVTAWLTLGRRGRLRCAQPPTIYFGPDGAREQHPKVFVRLLLYTSAARGHIVEGMFARLHRGDSVQTFGVWVVGKSGDLHRGAGVAVRQEGTALDHHFLLPSDGTAYQFLAGEYKLHLFAIVVGRSKPYRLTTVELPVTESQAERLREKATGLYFDWSPETGRYHGHIDRARQPEPLPLYMLAPEPRPKRVALPPGTPLTGEPQVSDKPAANEGQANDGAPRALDPHQAEDIISHDPGAVR
jgi:hypothetical protein